MTRQHTNHTEQRIFEALSERTGTATEIAARIPACAKNVKGILNRLHLCALVHVSGWRRGKSGPISKVYAIGPRVDAKHPGPMSNARVCKRYRGQLQFKFKDHYPEVRAMQRKKRPGSQLVVAGVVVYQQ